MASGQTFAVNAAAVDLYGYNRTECLAKNRVTLSAEPDANILSTMERTPFIPLQWHRKKDGTVFPVEISNRYFDLKGRSVCLSAIRDITVSRAIEELLKHSQENFSKAFHSNPASMKILSSPSRSAC